MKNPHISEEVLNYLDFIIAQGQRSVGQECKLVVCKLGVVWDQKTVMKIPGNDWLLAALSIQFWANSKTSFLMSFWPLRSLWDKCPFKSPANFSVGAFIYCGVVVLINQCEYFLFDPCMFLSILCNFFFPLIASSFYTLRQV